MTHYWDWYLSGFILFIVLAALWLSISTQPQTAQSRMSQFSGLCSNLLVSSLAYCILIFVLSLILATGIWLLLLLLVKVPSDWLANYFGIEQLRSLDSTIAPFTRVSANSPGFTGVPLLDYISSALILFGPVFAVISIRAQCLADSKNAKKQQHPQEQSKEQAP